MDTAEAVILGYFSGMVLGPLLFYIGVALAGAISDVNENTRAEKGRWAEYRRDRAERIEGEKNCRLKREAKMRGEHIAP